MGQVLVAQRAFLSFVTHNSKTLLKNKRMCKFMAFLRKQYLLGLFWDGRIRRHLLLTAHINIFSKLLINCTMDKLMLSTTENKNLSSAKRFADEEILLLRSFKCTLDWQRNLRWSLALQYKLVPKKITIHWKLPCEVCFSKTFSE